ncbi:MAG TPA: cytochrome c oxidase assembly protein [Gemmatimonadales bacterium]|nr:cytochrome c oxidase assembly protein [Gemmatimonadales bacterium]
MTPPPWNGWDLHPSVVIGLVLLGGLFVFWGGLRTDRRRVVAFGASLLVLFVSLNGPLHNLSDRYLFSAHMAQHLQLTLLFPPLLLYGSPAWVVRPILGARGVMPVARVLTRPVIAAAVFTVPIVLWHVPRFYEAALRHHNLHILQHLVFLTTAVIMWWPVLSPVPELPRIPYPGQMLYLFLLGLPMSITGALITLSDNVLYPFYAEAPRVAAGLDALADQQIGGLLMWVVGGLALWGAMTVVWFRWAVQEGKGDAERAVPLDVYALTRR